VPARAATRIADAVVQAVLAVLPELVGIRHSAEAAPVRRERHVSVGEASVSIVEEPLELGPVGERPALREAQAAMRLPSGRVR